MKVRSGFVSNSSSSSFVAVGIDCHHKQFKKLMDSIGFDLDWQRLNDLPNFISYDFGQLKSRTTGIVVYNDDQFAGLEADKLFRRNFRLSEIKTMFIRQCAEFGIKLHRNDVKLESGESRGC